MTGREVRRNNAVTIRIRKRLRGGKASARKTNGERTT